MAGCGCPDFDEMVVEQQAESLVWPLQNVADTVDEFAAWTGRDGVCVPGIEVVQELDSQGVYRGPMRKIIVRAGAVDGAITTRHELCHALDQGEKISREHKALFTGDHV
ncbi:unnamed protein product, partial [Ectocarpus fasciculatus]